MDSTMPLIDIFIYDTIKSLEELEQIMIVIEESKGFDSTILHNIHTIFHGIKESSTIMLFGAISSVADKTENMLLQLKDILPNEYDYMTAVDYILDVSDYIKAELDKISKGLEPSGNYDVFLSKADSILRETGDNKKESIKEQRLLTTYTYIATIYFQKNCEFEHFRAFSVIQCITEMAREIKCINPKNYDNKEGCAAIQKDGVRVEFISEIPYDRLYSFLSDTAYLEKLELVCLEKD